MCALDRVPQREIERERAKPEIRYGRYLESKSTQYQAHRPRFWGRTRTEYLDLRHPSSAVFCTYFVLYHEGLEYEYSFQSPWTGAANPQNTRRRHGHPGRWRFDDATRALHFRLREPRLATSYHLPLTSSPAPQPQPALSRSPFLCVVVRVSMDFQSMRLKNGEGLRGDYGDRKVLHNEYRVSSIKYQVLSIESSSLIVQLSYCPFTLNHYYC
jgi:hypothetical protein